MAPYGTEENYDGRQLTAHRAKIIGRLRKIKREAFTGYIPQFGPGMLILPREELEERHEIRKY